MKKSLRMVCNACFTDAEFEKNLETIKKNIDVVDEVAMFTEPNHHGYTPIEEVKRVAEILERRIKTFKEIGVPRVGINILCTIGHTEEGADSTEKGDLQYMLNIDGVESRSCLCPTNDKYLEYIYEKYAIYSRIGADMIWLDDDIRPVSHGVVKGEGCFCPDCINKLNQRTGKNYDIEYIRANWKTDKTLRDECAESSNDTMIKLFRTIRRAIRDNDPKADIGYMSGPANIVEEWITESGATLGRPGGGFYNERNLPFMFHKAFVIQRCNQAWPENIRDIQYEYETYNFRSFEKSHYISELETSLCIMVGCNGSLFNRWDWEKCHGFYDMMRKSAKKWDVLTDVNEGCVNAGVFCAAEKSAAQLNETGIPVTTYFDNAVASFIKGVEWNKFDDAMVEKIIKKGVLTDGKGFEVLNERGFGEYTGAKIKRVYKLGVTEYFSDHDFNGEYKNSARHISMDIFNEGDAYAFDCGDCDVLSYANFMNKEPIPSMYLYESDQGTKIVVDGCQMSGQMQTDVKQRQLMNIFAWLTGDKLPVSYDKSFKVVPTVTTDKDGGMNIMLVNATFDPTEEMDFVIDSDKKFSIISADGSLVPAKCDVENGKCRVNIENIPGWGYVLLTNKNA